ncbi:MAG TPA: GntR family transcriptional regulator [Flavitalea sp.]|nr:GntR family transcriptional regulator [Flavitalea sp.]
MQTIFEIDASRRTPKYLQIAHSITKAIKQGKIKRGDRILSINELSNQFFLSRDTVQKAYEILQKDKIIHAVQGKGFYINRTDIVLSYRVLLVFNKLSSYKKIIYDGFVKTMESKATVDLKIHHSNVKLFNDIISSSLGEYDYYLVMPHFYDHHEEAYDIMNKIPSDKLILLDKVLDAKFQQVAAVYQDFENDIIVALEAGLHQLKKYDTLIYADTPLTLKPVEIAKGFKRFCQQNHFAYQVIGEITTTHDVRSGQVYIVIDDIDLIHLIKSIQQKGFMVGKDIGIICYNETPLKEILLNGISTISTDHYQMGKAAAELILGQKTDRIKNQFTLISRASL